MGRLFKLRDAAKRLDRLSAVALIVFAAEIALIIFSLVGIALYQSASNERFGYSNAVRSADATLIAFLNAETGQRGYVITGDPNYLVPYNTGLDALRAQLDDLGTRIDENGAQRDSYLRLQELADEKVVEMEESVALRAAGNVEGSVSLIEAGTGRDLMNDIRAELSTIRGRDGDRLDSAIDRTDRYGVMTGVTAVALAIVTLGVLAWLYFAIRRQQETHGLREVARAKDEFVGFVSHELRTPIALISGNARVLAANSTQTIDPALRTEAAGEILEAGERLQSIVGTLLKLAKAEGGGSIEVEPVLVHRIAANVSRLHISRYPGREIDLSIAEDVLPALGDKDAIEQVLVNLLSNAEKYGDGQAPIVLDVCMEKGSVSVGVANEGPPLDPRAFERVFEPFFRAPASATREGVGLGLTICHRLVVAQGGRLSANVRPGGGAIFSFTLPAATLSIDD